MPINHNQLSKISKTLYQSETSLLIVTKKQSFTDISELISLGYFLFGENKVQEAEKKFFSYPKKNNLDIHLIGPLQTNKVKNALKVFNTIQTIDRKKLVDEIVKISSNKSNQIVTSNYFIQINIGDEDQKFGVHKSQVKELYEYAIMNNLNVVGFMCIPPINKKPEYFFQEMLEIRNNINTNLKLSMGMSNDYEVALKFKSNLIRIGSLIFAP